MPQITLLGPQQPIPCLITAVDSLGIRGRIAAITAGWEERELEDDELKAHLRGKSVNLQLWERTERVFERDPELLAGLRTRKERVLRLQEIYRMRLGHLLEAARELQTWKGYPDDLEPEQEDAFDLVRRLDRHQLEHVAEVNQWFFERYRPEEREDLVKHREEVRRIAEDCDAIAIAGGHVGVLLTRLRLFGIADLARRKTVIAWSAGTMVLTTRVVLFHDTPPQGKGHPEVFEPGLELVPGLVALPHARKRLRLEDPLRVQRLERRFAPDLCVPFDPFDRVDFDGKTLTLAERTRKLERDGRVTFSGAKA